MPDLEQAIALADRKQSTVLTEYIHPLQPLLEFGRGPEIQQLAKVPRIVKTAGLIGQHDVIRAGHPHKIVTTRGREKRQQTVAIILESNGIDTVDAQSGDAEVIVIAPIHCTPHRTSPGRLGQQGASVAIRERATIAGGEARELPGRGRIAVHALATG